MIFPPEDPSFFSFFPKPWKFSESAQQNSGSCEAQLSIRACNAATNKTLSLPLGQGIELGLLLLRLGLGRALEVVFVDAVYHHKEGQLKLLGLTSSRQGSSHGAPQRRGLAQALLLNESILVQSNSLDDLAFHENWYERKKPCLMLMLLSHVSKPPSLPNRLSLCCSIYLVSLKTSVCLLSADWRH